MTLQMRYQEKYEQGMQQGMEQGVEKEKMDSARRMLEAKKLSLEEVALYSGLSLAQTLEIEKELQPV